MISLPWVPVYLVAQSNNVRVVVLEPGAVVQTSPSVSWLATQTFFYKNSFFFTISIESTLRGKSYQRKLD